MPYEASMEKSKTQHLAFILGFKFPLGPLFQKKKDKQGIKVFLRHTTSLASPLVSTVDAKPRVTTKVGRSTVGHLQRNANYPTNT